MEDSRGGWRTGEALAHGAYPRRLDESGRPGVLDDANGPTFASVGNRELSATATPLSLCLRATRSWFAHAQHLASQSPQDSTTCSSSEGVMRLAGSSERQFEMEPFSLL